MGKRRQPLLKPKAIIDYLASDNTSAQAIPKVGREVIERVKKCFASANHESANEQEARAASRMAAKIMEQYSISQADIMINEDSVQREKRGGLSAVDIWPAKDGGRAFTPGWVDWLCGAVENFFDCRTFSTGHDDRIEWTFYGIAPHTVSAAIAFEAIHNQITDWSERFTGISTRNGYCLGVADGLLELSKDEKNAAESQARQSEASALAAKIKEEETESQARLSRLRNASLEPILELDTDAEMDTDDVDAMGAGDHEDTDEAANDTSDNEILPDYTERSHDTSATVDAEADFDTELRRFIPPNSQEKTTRPHETQTEYSFSKVGDDILPSTESTNEVSFGSENTLEWKSMRQLTIFREMSHEIEDKVLETHKIKVTKGRKKAFSVKNDDAFREGQRDSKKIEVRAARIETGHKHGPEAMDVS